MSIFDTINMIRKRPGMFLGSNSITALSHYLNGYRRAEWEYGVYYQKGELFPLPFRYMNPYAAYRLHGPNAIDWLTRILDSCNGVEDIALQKFFELWDEFQQIKMKRYWKAILSEQNIAWNNQMKRCYRCTNLGRAEEGKEPFYHNPLAVYVIELSISACLLVVETETDIQPETLFFSSPKKAKGDGHFPEGAEIYFGTIDSWEKFTAENISFNKNIII